MQYQPIKSHHSLFVHDIYSRLYVLRLKQIFSLIMTVLLLCACAESDEVNQEQNDAWIPSDPQMGNLPSMAGMDQPLAGTLTNGGMLAGTESGTQAGTQAGMTAGVQAGMAAGVQAGMTAGMIAGTQAGGTAGTQAGESAGTTAGTTNNSGTEAGTADLPPDPRVNAGWIGGPCTGDAECPYDGGVCLPDDANYPRGMCTQACERFCPDQDGLPITFCIDDILMTSGACVQRCDVVAFGGNGCRPGYECVNRGRSSEVNVQKQVCVPSDQAGMITNPPIGATACEASLSNLGLSYEYRGDMRDTTSDGSLECFVADGVRVSSPINGVMYRYVESATSTPIYGSCTLATALHSFSALLREYQIVEVGHIGTYNCRRISGTNSLSRHGYGDAIDVAFVRTANGDIYDLEDDWEHDRTQNFQTEAGRVLYELSREIYTRGIFNITLTPNYNAAHDNHFHLDLTPNMSSYQKSDETHFCHHAH